MNYISSKPLHMIPPLLAPVMAYILATVCFWHYPNFSMFTQACLALFLLLSLLWILSQSRYLAGFMVLMFAFGIVRNWQTQTYYASFPFDQTNTPTCIQGTIHDCSFQPHSYHAWCYTIGIKAIHETQKTCGHTILLYTQKKLNALPGDTIELENIVIKKTSSSDFHRYLMKLGVSATCFAKNPRIIITHRPFFSFTYLLFNLRNKILYAFKQCLNAKTFHLFSALFLGEKQLMKKHKENLEGPFKQWGIVHHLARSGLHLVIILFACSFLFRCIPIPLTWKQLLLVGTISIYALLSWTTVSFLRALVMFLIYSTCLINRISYHFLHILTLSCFILILSNPLYILFLDFQLSFGLTFCLAWLHLFNPSPIAIK